MVRLGIDYERSSLVVAHGTNKVKSGSQPSPYLIDIDGTVGEDIPNEEPERMATAEAYPDAIETQQMVCRRPTFSPVVQRGDRGLVRGERIQVSLITKFTRLVKRDCQKGRD